MFHATTPGEFYEKLGAERKKVIEQCVDQIRALDTKPTAKMEDGV